MNIERARTHLLAANDLLCNSAAPGSLDYRIIEAANVVRWAVDILDCRRRLLNLADSLPALADEIGAEKGDALEAALSLLTESSQRWGDGCIPALDELGSEQMIRSFRGK